MKKSDSIDKLVTALNKFKGEVTSIPRNGVNPHFKSKFSTLDDIDTVTRPLLAKHGLAVAQFPGFVENHIVLTTGIYHVSGQWMESDYPLMPVKQDPQSLGSAVTYARRYAKAAALDLVSDDDDDGNAATGKPVYQAQQTPTQAVPSTREIVQPPSPGVVGYKDGKSGITEKQAKFGFVMGKKSGWTDADMSLFTSKMFGVTDWKRCNKEQFDRMLKVMEVDSFPSWRAQAGLEEEIKPSMPTSVATPIPPAHVTEGPPFGENLAEEHIPF